MNSWATAGVTVVGEKVLWTDLLGGWVRWLRGVKEPDGLRVRPATARERTGLIAVPAAGTAAVALLFANISWSRITWSPAANACIFVGGAVATFALVDFWVSWNWINRYRRQRRGAELKAVAA